MLSMAADQTQKMIPEKLALDVLLIWGGREHNWFRGNNIDLSKMVHKAIGKFSIKCQRVGKLFFANL